MSIHELYESLTPAGFFFFAVTLFFLAGLFLGWCMWWWTARRHKQAQFDRSGIDGDVIRLKSENRELEQRLHERTTAASSNVDWASVSGIDPALANELNAPRNQNIDQLIR